MSASTRVQRESPYDGRFRAYDHTGRKCFYLETVYPIRNYIIDTLRWGLVRRSNRTRRLTGKATPSPSSCASCSPSTTLSPPDIVGLQLSTPSDPSTNGGKSTRKRPRNEPTAEAPNKKRKLGNDQPTTGLSPEALDILKPPRRIKAPQFACLSCRRRPASRACTLACYTAFRAAHFDPAREKLQIRKTAPGPHATGLGVFVKDGQRIAAGEWLGEYLGEVLPAAAREAQTSAYAFTLRGYAADRVPELVVDAQTHGNWTRFVNSSCRPNVAATPEQIGKVRIVAFRAETDIAAGEQVLINYGRDYFAERGIMCCCEVSAQPHLPPQ